LAGQERVVGIHEHHDLLLEQAGLDRLIGVLTDDAGLPRWRSRWRLMLPEKFFAKRN
jgi:hypothetical protein